MKKRTYRAKATLFILSVISVMEMTACSLESKGGTAVSEANIEPKTNKVETTIAIEDNEKEDLAVEEINEGDPIVGIVDDYADNIIVIRDGGDQDLIYYFSTQNAQVVEGDSSIAAGDIVEITYRGVMGDEEHPGVAVKVVRQ